MRQGKHICETLKNIRREIAEANEIDYQPTECTHEGDCAGTCPKCESETRWLERQLRSRQALGKAVTIAGLSVALGAMSSCHPKIFQPDGMIMMPPENGNNISAPRREFAVGSGPPAFTAIVISLPILVNVRDMLPQRFSFLALRYSKALPINQFIFSY